MEAKQVFETYDRNNAGTAYETHVFCAKCGGQYVEEERGGRLRKTCKKCGYIYYRNPTPAISVLIMEEDRVLLCKRKQSSFQGNKWCLPCGFIEHDEDFLSAAIREVKEETGLDVTIQSILSVVSNFFRADLHTVVVALLAKQTGGNICDVNDNEIDATAWFSIKELPDMAFGADTHLIERYTTGLIGAPVDPSFAIIQDTLRLDSGQKGEKG